MLDISYLSDQKGQSPSFLIKDHELKYFERLFEILRKKTGVYIDPYGKSRIYPEHQQILISAAINERERKVCDFVIFLETACKANEVLLADGD